MVRIQPARQQGSFVLSLHSPRCDLRRSLTEVESTQMQSHRGEVWLNVSSVIYPPRTYVCTLRRELPRAHGKRPRARGHRRRRAGGESAAFTQEVVETKTEREGRHMLFWLSCGDVLGSDDTHTHRPQQEKKPFQ